MKQGSDITLKKLYNKLWEAQSRENYYQREFDRAIVEKYKHHAQEEIKTARKDFESIKGIILENIEQINKEKEND